MSKPVVDKDKCIGCGTCAAMASQTFKIGDDGKAQVVANSSDNQATIQSAIDSCPVSAISWEEEVK
jgi:ferredoxin